MPKPHGTDDEILFLIMRRRMQARQAMAQIVDGFEQSARFPKVAMLLDYLSNMVLCLELMLKLLSETWENHELSPLYEKVFGTPYSKSNLLDYIKTAMLNQKYFFEPSSDLAGHIPEMEELFQSLLAKLKEKHGKFQLIQNYSVPEPFGKFLHEMAPVFHKTPGNIGESFDAAFERHADEVHRIQHNISQFLKFRGCIEFHQGETWSVGKIDSQ